MKYFLLAIMVALTFALAIYVCGLLPPSTFNAFCSFFVGLLCGQGVLRIWEKAFEE